MSDGGVIIEQYKIDKFINPAFHDDENGDSAAGGGAQNNKKYLINNDAES